MGDEFLDRVKERMSELATVMARLRAPGGCPWDREQTLTSLKPYVIEEAYEVLEAIESGDPKDHCEELGDLLMQVVFQAEVTREAKQFDLADVANAIATKLVRRHPHVFGDVTVKDSNEVLNNWEALKKKEKAGRTALSGVPRALPGLIRALRMGEKAARAGFDFADAAQAMTKVHEETKELMAAKTPAEKQHELGDLLFAVVNVARKEGLDPEEALREAMDRFGTRFGKVEAAAGDNLVKMSDAEKEALWQKAKTGAI
jgi:tetrapyrrole methylase family protein/MazG family protein